MNCKYLHCGKGRKIAYHKYFGTEPGVVFLGGFSSDMDGTKAIFLEKFWKAQGRSFLRFDYSGHGQSSGQFEDGCIGVWAEDAAAAVQNLTDGPQIIVGSSMGGWIALLLAKRIPSKVAGLVGIASAPDFTLNFEHELLDEFQKRQLWSEGRIELPSEYSDDPLVITRKLIEDGRNNLVLDEPLRLPFPTRFLQGSDDHDVDQAVAIRLFDHVEGPDIQLTIVKGADHRFSSDNCLTMIIREIDAVSEAVG